jgi:AAA domain
MTSRVILLVGCAGSGKSTYAQQQFPGTPIVSADHYFERLAERFKQTYEQVFDVRQLRDAHSQCEEAFLAAIARNAPIVIVDNTNVRGVDQRRYAKKAKALGCETELHVFSPWLYGDPAPSPKEILRYVRLCHGRSVHGVPLDIVEKQFSELELPSGIYLAGKPPQYLRPMPS